MKRLLFVVLSTMLMIAIIITVCGTALADAACPSIGSTVYELDARNDVVRWVQNELKATGVWYQGNEWKVTGHLGKGTMREISRFMEYMGYPGQSGAITQKVIDALCQYLGDGITSVDYNARASGSNNSNSTDAGETIRCSCGGIMTCEVFTGGYTSDETGHCLDTGRIFTCQSCGAQGFEGAPGEGTWEPHVFNGYNICTVCGFDRGD